MKIPQALIDLARKFSTPQRVDDYDLAPSPASVTLAQAIIETSTQGGGAFSSPLFANGNNCFGIKMARDKYFQDGAQSKATHEWDGTQMAPASAAFAKYISYERCFQDRGRILSLDCYAPDQAAVAAKSLDLERFAKCIGTWSTDPTYAKMLLDLVDQHDLRQYDVPVTPKRVAVPPPAPQPPPPPVVGQEPWIMAQVDSWYAKFHDVIAQELVVAEHAAARYLKGGYAQLQAIAVAWVHQAEENLKGEPGDDKLRYALEGARLTVEAQINWDACPFLVRGALRDALHFALSQLIEGAIQLRNHLLTGEWSSVLNQKLANVGRTLGAKIETTIAPALAPAPVPMLRAAEQVAQGVADFSLGGRN